jgi:hypothetical protein
VVKKKINTKPEIKLAILGNHPTLWFLPPFWLLKAPCCFLATTCETPRRSISMVSSPVACGDGSGEENLGLQTTETGFETLEKHGFNLFQVTEIIV